MLAKNESQMDRAIRLVVGLVLLAIGYQFGGWLQIVLYVLAIYALITAAAGTCWLYKILGMNTAKGEVKTTASVETKEEPKEEPKIMPAVEPEAAPSDAEVMENKEEMPAEEETPEVAAEEEVPEVAEEPVEEPKETAST